MGSEMPQTCARLLTVGEIARRLGEPIHRIEYIIRTRDICPKSWAGSCRVFHEDDVTYIASELRRIDADRSDGRLPKEGGVTR